MRNVKKFLALVLAMLMVVSAAATVSAFEDVADDHVFAAAINDLTVKEIVNGYDGETFGPDDAVTRQQMALMMARAITGNVGDDAVWAQGGLVGFEDVTEYQYAIATVVKAGIVDGFLDNTFRPEEGITFVQALKMAVCALGYDDGNLDWWQGYYNVALDLGLTEKLNYITDADKALNRGEVAQLIYNMLYIDLADGSDCFASQNFGLATTENVTTFVITATDKQTAAAGMDVTEGGFVGVQKLVNGVPEGDVYYIANEAFGFEENEDEDAFLSAYGFVNWDNGDFDQIIPVGESWKVYNTEITKSSSKFAYDGKNYYPVDELTGTAIKNEVVVYNATDYGYTATNKQLFLNKAGQVLDPETGVAVLEAVYAVNGDVVSYRELRGDNKGNYLSIAAATEKYGVAIGEVVVPYETMDVADLAGAFELTVYDDDMDGKMDRAYYNPVYVSAHEATLSDGKLQYGPMKVAALKNTTFVDVDGETVALDDGQVYKYTYNKQLNEVTVLDTYDVEKGTLQRVNTTADKSSANYVVKLTIDGEVYTMGNAWRDAKGLDGFMIANQDAGIISIANVSGKDNDGSNYTKAEGNVIGDGLSTIGYTYDVNFAANTFKAGDLVRFIAVDGVITVLEAYDIEEAYDLVILDEAVDFDLEAIYMNLWFDGELVEDVAVTRIWDETTEKYVDIADLNYFKLNNLMTQVFEAKTGYAYRAVPTADGWQLSEAFKNVTADQAPVYDKNGDYKTNNYGLAYLEAGDGEHTLVFDDGIGDTNSANTKDVLRTKKSTIFYFVNAEKDVYVYVGKPADGATIYDVDDGVEVYANKLGYTTYATPKNNIKGEADVVVVYYDNIDQVKGFGLTGVGEKIVYITTCTYSAGYFGREGYLFDPYDNGTGKELGLSKEYWNDEFWYYNTNLGIDMHTGAPVNKIYAPYSMDIAQGHYYYLSDDNVVIGLADNAVKTTNMATTDVVEWRGAYTVTVDNLGAQKVDTLKFANANAEMKAANIKADTSLLATTDKVVSYINDFEDGIFVGIVGDAVTVTPPTVVVDDGEFYIRNPQGVVIAGTEGSITLGETFDAETLLGSIAVNGQDATAPKTTAIKLDVKVYDYEEGDFVDYKGTNKTVVTGSYEKGTLSISKIALANSATLTLGLEEGTYIATFIIGSGDYTNERVIMFEFTVAAAE